MSEPGQTESRQTESRQSKPGLAALPAPQKPAPAPVKEQRATWLELFFDLVFVTAFDQLAQRLTKDDSLRGAAIFALMFGAVWWAWVGNTIFAGRYGNEGRAYRWGTSLQLLSVGGLALGVLGDLKDVGAFFSVLFGANRLILVSMYAVQGYATKPDPDADDPDFNDLETSSTNADDPETGGPDANGPETDSAETGSTETGDADTSSAPDPQPARQRLRGFLPGAALWLASAWLPVGWQQVAWGAALGLDILASLSERRSQPSAMPHPEHLPERVGLLSIISLGAVITEIIRGAGAQPLTLLDQLPAVISVLITLSVFKLYFDEARGLPVLLAHRDGRIGTLLSWLYAHLPLNLAITALGVGLGHGIAVDTPKADEHERVTVALSLSLVFVNLAALRLLTRHALSPLSLARAPSVHSVWGDRSVWAMLLGTAAVLGLMFAPLPTLGHQAAVLGVCGLALLVFWRDPVRRRLSETQEAVTDELHDSQSDGAQSDDAQSDGAQSGSEPSKSSGGEGGAPTPET